MNRMNITKSAFMEYIRCNRYPALNHIYKRKDFDDALLDRYYDIIDGLGSSAIDIDDDVLSPDLEHLEVMMPYFTKIEVLAARKIMSEWQGQTRYGTEYGEQKLFLRDHNGFNLMCYVDIYNKQDHHVNIVEVKGTTSNKYMSMAYTEDRIQYPIFELYEDGILHLREERNPELCANEKYNRKRQRLLERFSDEGVYVYDLAFQRFVIEADLSNAKYYLGVLNHEYVFDGTYFEGEPVYTNDSIRFIDVSILTKELQPKIERDIDVIIERIKNDNEDRVRLGKHCQLKKQRECVFKDLCYDQFPKTNNILQYIDKHHGFKDEAGNKYDVFELIEEGFRTMEDIPHEWLSRRNNQIQRDCAITHKPFVDRDKIRDGIAEIEYPIYHLDFESFPCPLPRFRGEKPYMQSLFQFSLHIETTPGSCDKIADHYEYLSRNHEDNREELVRLLCESIGDTGSVMVYNQAFEKTRIKELAELFPAYSEKLLAINERLFDLMHIIKTNSKLYEGLGYDADRAKTVNYYHEDLVGSYSIKKVLPIFSDLTYQGMTVGNGMEAVYAYASYPKFDADDLRNMQAALIQYCQQDTWAMVEILNQLRKI
ncbi:DUF2779 domain-containing protein [Candidatus Xianfuyuplasma coldseepsis]|uniref:DUF2779 domain-containing protein n=1 Tax=Candidatus Xianfuyuplasma coldseepsis TaxID=2782163 RepID=A0A7L7KU36_9MOLU|nr:DUF2779 domain-containing protein [Xianfuyuplasma coldseepsis]QMS85756.1 DUF2779 domain-containing protein [Xianfuyuplasma coldseepsis]